MGIKSSAFGGLTRAQADALYAIITHHATHESGGADAIAAALALAGIPTPLTGKVITDITQGTHANRPAAGNVGKIYAETDTGSVFWDDGTVWQDCKPPILLAGLTVAEFQTNAATGTMELVAALNDNNTATQSYTPTVGAYGEVVLPSMRCFNRFRQWGVAGENEDGTWKIQFWDSKNEVWVDWMTGIPTQVAGEWGDYIKGVEIVTEKVRFVAETIDSSGNSRAKEIEIDHD